MPSFGRSAFSDGKFLHLTVFEGGNDPALHGLSVGKGGVRHDAVTIRRLLQENVVELLSNVGVVPRSRAIVVYLKNRHKIKQRRHKIDKA